LLTKLEKGVLLFAEPSITGDISFSRSVVLLTNHNKDGSIGFVLNKPLNFTLTDLIPEISKDFKVYNGGPVEQDNLYFIHNKPHLIKDSIEITDGIFWGGNFEIVLELIKANLLNKNDIKFFLGYSGWDFNQLDNELRNQSWIVSENCHKENIIKVNYEKLWKNKMLQLGEEYSIWSNSPEDPTFN